MSQLQQILQVSTQQEPGLLDLPAPNPTGMFSSIQTNKDLANKLLTSTKRLIWLGRNKSENYTQLRLRKRDGTYRLLFNPSSSIRYVQYNILKKILESFNIPDYIHAFEKEKSIPAMANIHVGKQVIISVDIKDFFTSIKQNKIYSLLLENGMGALPSRTVSEICTYKAFVPQGGLTSPKIANIITANTFGPVVKTFCDERGLTLTIYADDLTISSDSRDVNISEVLTFLRSTLRNFGFRLNKNKTKVMFKSSRQYVCGVVVNEKTNLIKSERYKLRAIVHNIVHNGLETEAAKNSVDKDKFLSHIKGRLNWFKQLNPDIANKLIEKLDVYLKSVMDMEVSEQLTYATSASGAVSNLSDQEAKDLLGIEDKVEESR